MAAATGGRGGSKRRRRRRTDSPHDAPPGGGEASHQTHLALRAPLSTRPSVRSPAAAPSARAPGFGAPRPPPPPHPLRPWRPGRPGSRRGGCCSPGPGPRLARRARLSSAAAAGSPIGAASWSRHRAPWPSPPAPALLHGPRAGSCFPGGCGSRHSPLELCKGAPAPRGCSVESPGSAPRPRARRRGYRSPGASPKSRWRSRPGSAGRRQGRLLTVKLPSMRPSSSRPSPPPHQPDLILVRLLF